MAAPLRRRASATIGRTSLRNAPLQHLGGERRVVGVLRVAQRGAVDEQRLGDGDLDLVGGLDQVLERILEVVRRVDHVATSGIRRRRA